jgi:hypothetical protein
MHVYCVVVISLSSFLPSSGRERMSDLEANKLLGVEVRTSYMVPM